LEVLGFELGLALALPLDDPGPFIFLVIFQIGSHFYDGADLNHNPLRWDDRHM
jgi:hypothetical protein